MYYIKVIKTKFKTIVLITGTVHWNTIFRKQDVKELKVILDFNLVITHMRRILKK